jgi:hypothetical protein
MEPTHSESLEASLLSLGRLDKAHLELGKQMFEAFGGAMYGMGLLAAGALNRSKAHIAGFRTLLEAKNLICAGARSGFSSILRCGFTRRSWLTSRTISRLQYCGESAFEISGIATARK